MHEPKRGEPDRCDGVLTRHRALAPVHSERRMNRWIGWPTVRRGRPWERKTTTDRTKNLIAMNLTELCETFNNRYNRELSRRTVRFYMQRGLVDRPEGVARAATYDERHLNQLKQVDDLKAEGLSLNKIKEVKERAFRSEEIPLKPAQYGATEYWTRVYLTDGVELLVDGDRAQLSAAQADELVQQVSEFVTRLLHQDTETREPDTHSKGSNRQKKPRGSAQAAAVNGKKPKTQAPALSAPAAPATRKQPPQRKRPKTTGGQRKTTRATPSSSN